MNNTPTTKQQNYLIKTMELMQLNGRTDHYFKLMQGDLTIYSGNNSQAALDSLSALRRKAIKRLKAGKSDINAVLICQYPDGNIEIVGEV